MGVVNIVKSNPKIFGDTFGEIDSDEAWRIIASIQSNGGNTQKNGFSISEKFTAVSNLFKLGLREEAVEISLVVLKQAIRHQHYSIAQQLCSLLVIDSYMDNDIDSARKYDILYRSYTDLIELDYQFQLNLGEILNKYERGLNFNELEIIRSLQLIEERLPSENLPYEYYYHSFQLMISSDSEYEAKLQNAISYFENQYFDHKDYLSSFVIKLIKHYNDEENHLQAEVLLDCHLNKCNEGSKLWFKYLKMACLLYLKNHDIVKAKVYMTKSFNSTKYYTLSDDEKKEWNEINAEIQAK